MTKEVRTKTVKIMLTNAEHELLLSKKTEHHLAAWMRSYCLSSKVQRFRKTADPVLIRQIAWIGNNLNQIARQINTQPDTSNTIEVLVALKNIEQQIKNIGDSYDQYF